MGFPRESSWSTARKGSCARFGANGLQTPSNRSTGSLFGRGVPNPENSLAEPPGISSGLLGSPGASWGISGTPFGGPSWGVPGSRFASPGGEFRGDPLIHGSTDPRIHGSTDPLIHGSTDPLRAAQDSAGQMFPRKSLRKLAQNLVTANCSDQDFATCYKRSALVNPSSVGIFPVRNTATLDRVILPRSRVPSCQPTRNGAVTNGAYKRRAILQGKPAAAGTNTNI